MKRPRWLGLAAVTLGAALCVGLAAGRQHLLPLTLRVTGAALSLVDRAVAGTAFAQQTLDFKPVPPESLTELERARARRRAERVPPPSGEDARTRGATPPAAPTPPEPAQPESGVVIAGRSGDMMRIGQDIHVERDQTITGDVVAMGGDITVDGHVEGDVQAMGGDVYLNSTARVDGDVLCMGGTLHEETGAQVGGQRVTALGPRRKHWDRATPIAPLHGEREEHVGGVGAALILLLVFTALAWGFARLAPGRTGAALARFRKEPGPSLLVGLLIALVWLPGFIAVALLAALLCITLIGIPVAIVLLLAYPLLLALLGVWGWAVLAAGVGARVVRGGEPAPPLDRAALFGGLLFGGTLLAGALLHLLGPFGPLGTLIRVLAWIAFGIGCTIGAGALVRHEFAEGTLHRWWTGRRPAGPGAAPPAPAVTAPVMSPAPPPPAPPAAFMPPADPSAGPPGGPPAAV